MEVEYSSKRNRDFAFTFSDCEKKSIARGLKSEITRLNRRIESIRNNPKNEGQVTFQVQVEHTFHLVKQLEDIIKEFSS